MLEERYQKDPSIVYREIAGEAILVPIRRSAGELESIFTLNETAARLWQLLDGQRTLGEICSQMVSEYEVTEQEAQQDLYELVEQLEEIQAIQRA